MLSTDAASATPTWLEARVPSLLHVAVVGLEAWQWLGLVVGALVSYAAGRVIAYVLVFAASRITRRTKASWDDGVIDALRGPSRFVFGFLTFDAILRALLLPPDVADIARNAVGTVVIGAAAWIAVRLVGVLAAYVEGRARESAGEGVEAELSLRGIKTNVRVLRRVASVCIGIIGLALMLTQFAIVRSVGVSLLASAGLAGVVLGFAAQRTFGSLIAGIQLSATQPIRIGDVVVIEKEWGTIEEITLTYVVVKVWDERRLIVPVVRFLEHPFENWTKTSSELHGAVMLYVDWTMPVSALRKHAERLVEAHPLWDGRTKSVQVTQAKEHTIEVRVLVSASDPSNLWTLRVDVRERLLEWLQTYENGRFLPRLRLEGDAATQRPTANHA